MRTIIQSIWPGRMGRYQESNKIRHYKKTALVFGEGLKEARFLRYLNRLYTRGNRVTVFVRSGRGGTADQVVIDAGRGLAGHDKRIVVLDNDKPVLEMKKARSEAGRRGIELIENTPCLEAVLLSILGVEVKRKGSGWCKKELESNYMVEATEEMYFRMFPKKLLNKQKEKFLMLSRIISIMEGKF